MPLTKNGKNKKSIMFEGKIGTAENTYIKIFREAKDSIIVIDPDLSVKTLEYISAAKVEVPVLIYSDNEGKAPLTRQNLKRFFEKNAGFQMLIGTVAGKCKGRYIVIDSGTENAKAFLMSAPFSDEGKENACIIQMEDVQLLEELLKELQKNAYLVLK